MKFDPHIHRLRFVICIGQISRRPASAWKWNRYQVFGSESIRHKLCLTVYTVCCREVLQIGSPLDQRVTEKGVLQLLFDARFLRDALASSPADSSADSAAAGSRPPAETKRAFAALEASLQVLVS